MAADDEIHKIRNELVLIKVFFSTYEDCRGRKGGEKLINKSIKECKDALIRIEKLLKRLEKLDGEKENRRNNR
jgi:hypothetical protein